MSSTFADSKHRTGAEGSHPQIACSKGHLVIVSPVRNCRYSFLNDHVSAFLLVIDQQIVKCPLPKERINWLYPYLTELNQTIRFIVLIYHHLHECFEITFLPQGRSLSALDQSDVFICPDSIVACSNCVCSQDVLKICCVTARQTTCIFSAQSMTVGYSTKVLGICV